MASIVEYDERKKAVNAYPDRIISPPQPSGCCTTGMRPIGDVQEDGDWLYTYKRCQSCGYTVRRVLVMNPRALRRMRAEILQGLN
jgi:hypothetical protein